MPLCALAFYFCGSGFKQGYVHVGMRVGGTSRGLANAFGTKSPFWIRVRPSLKENALANAVTPLGTSLIAAKPPPPQGAVLVCRHLFNARSSCHHLLPPFGNSFLLNLLHVHDAVNATNIAGRWYLAARDCRRCRHGSMPSRLQRSSRCCTLLGPTRHRWTSSPSLPH